MVTWGLGLIGDHSYRTLCAQLGDELERAPAASVRQAAERFAQLLWAAYSTAYSSNLAEARELAAADNRSPEQESRLRDLRYILSGGVCIGGWCPPERRPSAYEITFAPDSMAASLEEVVGGLKFWGARNVMERTLFGIDLDLMAAIQSSGQWRGTPEELADLVRRYKLSPPGYLPIREAIDWVHSSIEATIKGLKFSTHVPICGGPVEVAVITSDRLFRWVTHKSMAAAIHGWTTQEDHP